MLLNKPPTRDVPASARRMFLSLAPVALLTACMAEPDVGSSSSLGTQSSVEQTSAVSSSSFSSVSPAVSSALSLSAQSSSDLNNSSLSADSSSAGVSSSSVATQTGQIIPRTSCPAAPPSPDYGGWEPHYAEAAYPSTHDTVRDFKELMVQQPVFNETGIELPWNLHTPFQAEGDPEALFPLVVYLHGGAERGRDPGAPNVHLNNRHAKNFFASANSLLTQAHQQQFPAYILAPLCDCSFYANEWSSGGGPNFNVQDDPSDYGNAVLSLIEKLIADKQIDPARIYVTGPSMGGGGSWEFAVRRPDLFAAAIPLAGHPPSSNDLSALQESLVPVWSNHGEGDGSNPIGDAQNAVDYVSDGGGCAWISRYPQGTGADDPADSDPSDAPHNIWARAYTNPDLWPWVFSISQPRE